MDPSTRQDKKSSITSSKAISLLVTKLEKILKGKGAQLKEIPEFKKLKEKCCSDDICEAFAAFQGLTVLVERGLITGSRTLSCIISLLPSITHYSPMVMAIGNILLFQNQELEIKSSSDYNFSDKLHPLITVLKHNSEKSWDAVYCYFKTIFYSEKNMSIKSKINLLKEVMQYIFIDPDLNLLSCRCDVFDLLLEHMDEPKIKFLIVELLTWHNLDLNFCKLLEKTLTCLMKFPKIERLEIVVGLTPSIAIAIKWLILNGYDPMLWIQLLSKSLEHSRDGSSIVLYILSDVFLQTPTFAVNKLADICTSIIFSCSCNKFVAHKFAAMSLIWMVNPSSLAEPLFKTLESIIKFLALKCTSKDWNTTTRLLGVNPYFNIMKNNSSDVKMAFDVSVMTDTWDDRSTVLCYLQNFTDSNHLQVLTSLQAIISGIVLIENDGEVLDACLDILARTSATDSDLGLFYLCLMFFKLSKEGEPKYQLKYLQSLAEMAKSKENVPLIIGIIETLKSGNVSVMWPVVIDLYLKLWRTDKRTYPYLHKSLFNSSSYCENTWELSIIKAVAMREICKLSPEVHGKGVVSKLSEVLNDCDHYESGIPSAIAIEAVIELCKASVIDICGTWKTLKPKLSRDTRPGVIASLCKLFGEIPSLKPPGAERDSLMNDVIPRLWQYAFSSNLQVVRAALSSLSKFNAESYGPKLLPVMLRSDIDLPRQYCKVSNEIQKNEYLDRLEYIPGECWIEFLQKIDSRALKEAGDMLKLLIEEELENLPRRHFCVGDEMPEPESYSHLPHSSICRAMERYVKNYLNSSAPKGNKVPQLVTEILRILSLDYFKCLPSLNWSFLHKFFTLGDECKKYSILILVKQSSISRAGKKTFEYYMTNNMSKFNEANEYLFLYPVLPYLSHALGANVLKQFFDKTIKSACDMTLNSDLSNFEIILKHIGTTLEGKSVTEPRKALLLAHIQNILAQIPPEHEMMKIFANFATGLPPKIVECLTSPALWPSITSEKIRQSVRIKAAVAARPECLQPLPLLHEIIDAVINFPSEYDLVIISIMHILRKKRHICHTNWLLELIWKIQSAASTANTPDLLRVTLFLMDVFVMSMITISGLDFLIVEHKQKSLRNYCLNLFPMALYRVLDSSEYSYTSPKILDCVHTLSNWKKLPDIYVKTLRQSILTNRTNKYCFERSKWQQLLYIPIEINCL